MSQQQNEQRFADIAARLGAAVEGVVTAQDWDNGFVTVDLGGTTQRMQWAVTAPWPGDRVWVISQGKTVRCVPVYGSGLGSVQSVASGRATVLADDGVRYTYPYIGAVPGVSDRVALNHASRQVLGAISAEPADSEFQASPPPPVPSIRKRWFSPVWSGNWRSGSYEGPLVEISTTRVGAYGYGTQIRDTIPNSAVPKKATLYLSENWDNVSGVASSMGLHSFNTRPASMTNANLSGSYSVPGTSLNVLGAVINSLNTGAALGIGFRSGSSGWRQYGAAPSSGRIYVEW